MKRNIVGRTAKQFCHATLRDPNGFIFDGNFDLYILLVDAV